ncbi:MAG: efflux RND transporter periplasmic adaptor subunit [Alphaproteobacteria bacterium]|nr:efflux RND transporter periplasmic adaptor subunit [Alphaproteobacteria bacterium]
MPKIIIRLVIIFTILGGAAYYGFVYRGNKPQGQGAPQMGAMAVSIAEVIEEPHTEWRLFSGRLEAFQEAAIRSRVSGTIDSIHFQEGAQVKKGDKLITIDPRPFQAAVEQSQGQAQAAEANYENANTNYERALKLIETHAISQREMDEATSQMKQTKGAFNTAKANVTQANLNLAYANITAPISGKVGRIEVKVGNVVDAGANSPVLTSIVSTSPIYASFDMDEQTYLGFTKDSSPAKLKDIPVELSLTEKNEFPYQGHIDSFDNQLNITTGTMRVRAILDNDDGALVPGLFAHVRIGSPKPQNVILINERGINTDQDKKFVFVVNGKSIAEFRQVELGESVNGLRVIRSGLNKGDKIIVNGLFMIRPGMPVAPTLVDMKTLQPEPSNGQKPSSSQQEL